MPSQAGVRSGEVPSSVRGGMSLTANGGIGAAFLRAALAT